MGDQPKLILRPEHDEWDLIAAHDDLFDVVLVQERYAAPYPKGHRLHDQDHERLVKAAGDVSTLWRDPDTAGLRSRSVLKLSATARLLGTPAARAEELPFDLANLQDDGRRNALLDPCLEAQVGSEILAAPYFDFRSIEDPWLKLNLALARRVVESAGDQIPTAFVQVTANRLLRGLFVDVAPQYATIGIKRVVLRARGMHAPTAPRPELAAYLDAIETFESYGIETFADCAGRLGPVLVAGGAHGFSTGTRFFQKVAEHLISVGDGGGGGPIARQVAGGWSEVPRDSEATAAETRVSNLQTLRAHMLVAANDPEALIESLRQDGAAPYALGWAAELAERRQRAA